MVVMGLIVVPFRGPEREAMTAHALDRLQPGLALAS
jgi:hypothetical protein